MKQQPRTDDRKTLHTPLLMDDETELAAVSCGIDAETPAKKTISGPYCTRTRQGNTGITDSAAESGAECGALSRNSDPKPAHAIPADPDLSAVIAAWPNVPPAIRAGILAMVKAATGDPCSRAERAREIKPITE